MDEPAAQDPYAQPPQQPPPAASASAPQSWTYAGGTMPPRGGGALAPVGPGMALGYGGAPGPPGRVRSTGLSMLLFVVTFGIYGLVWFYQVHAEMKRHTGEGLGGGLALLLAFFVGIAMPYVTSSEVGDLYRRRGRPAPVSGLTGLWNFPGSFILVGPIVWFALTNSALNEYWHSVGVH